MNHDLQTFLRNVLVSLFFSDIKNNDYSPLLSMRMDYPFVLRVIILTKEHHESRPADFFTLDIVMRRTLTELNS
jgi:hypothetical protein